ncbi:hypothetical protein [Butyrivibrio sp. JL13D10]|uniref:hypothetical protein n=1 Tax=Butyrivibrio sp. JL13D10 TaxID=3236815 RepID=UPI0038B55408
MNMSKRCFMKLGKLFAIFVFMLAVAFAVNPISSQAKTIKITKSINTKWPAIKKKYAKKVTKGKTTVKITNKNGAVNCLVFKVPTTKTWKFTASGIKSHDSEGITGQVGSVFVANLRGTGYKMKVRGGKASVLSICTSLHIQNAKAFEEKYHTKFDNDTPETKRYTSRTGTVKLKKGEMVYITFEMQGVKSFNLNIQ